MKKGILFLVIIFFLPIVYSAEQEFTLRVKEGWNFVGIAGDVDNTKDLPFFGLEQNAWKKTTMLAGGKGYFVDADKDGTITLQQKVPVSSIILHKGSNAISLPALHASSFFIVRGQQKIPLEDAIKKGDIQFFIWESGYQKKTFNPTDLFSAEKGYLVLVQDDAVLEWDSDGDGIFDSVDKCPATPKGQKVAETGCPPCVDKDTDGYGVGDVSACAKKEVDCDDNNKAIYPTAAEICNGKDDNCDGKVDENVANCCNGIATLLQSDSSNCGECGKKCSVSQSCSKGKCVACTDTDGDGYGVGDLTPCTKKEEDCDDNDKTVFPGAPELCDGKRNDCRRQEPVAQLEKDITLPCYSGQFGTAGKGECKTGTQICANGKLSTCTGETVPATEVCDGKDNNCDGKVDEGFDLQKDVKNCGKCGITCKSGELCSKGICQSLGPYRPIYISSWFDQPYNKPFPNPQGGPILYNWFTTEEISLGKIPFFVKLSGNSVATFAMTEKKTKALDFQEPLLLGAVHILYGCWGCSPPGEVSIKVDDKSYKFTIYDSFTQLPIPNIEYSDVPGLRLHVASIPFSVPHSFKKIELIEDYAGGQLVVVAMTGEAASPCSAGDVKCVKNTLYECTNGLYEIKLACKSTEQCDAVTKSCILQCASGQKNCGGFCADTTNDLKNCGFCGKACLSGQVCQKSQCIVPCVDKDGDGYGIGDVSGCPHKEIDCDDTNRVIYPTASEMCNGKDDNCDGKVDENVANCCNGIVTLLRIDSSNCGECGKKCPAGQSCSNGKCVACTDTDGDWYGVGDLTACTKKEEDCDDNDKTVFPGAPELCDGKRNDCRRQEPVAQLEKDITLPCYSGQFGTASKGECKIGTQVCSNGKLSTCTGEVIPATETCDGKDNNCDGKIDELFDLASDVKNCGKCKKACADGELCQKGECITTQKSDQQACTTGKECQSGFCVHDVCRSTALFCGDGFCDAGETCSGEDSKCSYANAAGQCANGCQLKECLAWFGNCDNNRANGCEVNFLTDPNNCGTCASSAFIGQGKCLAGGTCANGRCAYCNDVDKDGYGVGDLTGCINKAPDCNDYDKTINPGATESCNGKDDNCNGKVDENIALLSCYTGPADTAGKGECKTGTQQCISGKLMPCVGEINPSLDLCDGKDNNCDGQVDEGGICVQVECTSEKELLSNTLSDGAVLKTKVNQKVKKGESKTVSEKIISYLRNNNVQHSSTAKQIISNGFKFVPAKEYALLRLFGLEYKGKECDWVKNKAEADELYTTEDSLKALGLTCIRKTIGEENFLTPGKICTEEEFTKIITPFLPKDEVWFECAQNKCEDNTPYLCENGRYREKASCGQLEQCDKKTATCKNLGIGETYK